MRNTCKVCKNNIKIMINRGSGVCSENCRKRLAIAEKVHKEGAK